MNPASARGLVPPRPNLGPDPWTEAQPTSPFALAGAILAGVLVVWLLGKVLARRPKRRTRGELADAGSRDPTPRGQLVAHSDSIRNVLATQFGPTWRAKTVEELSAEPRLAEVLGREQLHELIRFLDQVDHLKFAPERSKTHADQLGHELETWAPRIADLKRAIQARPEPARPDRARVSA